MLLSHDDVGLHVLGLLSHIKFFLLWGFTSTVFGKAYYERASGSDDDELMLNVLRCHLTY